jgi:hypothetical protein
MGEYLSIIERHMTAPGRIMGKPSVKALRKRLAGRVADDTLRRSPDAKENVGSGTLGLSLFSA